MKLSGNVVLFTGATSGIGRELAERFCLLNNRIIAVGRNQTELGELARLDNQIITYKCDLTSQSELDDLVAFTKREHADLNVLINNAGIQYHCNLQDNKYSIRNIESEINTNFTVLVKLTAFLLPVLQRNSYASLVNLSSGLTIFPKAQAAVYYATKAAIHIFSKSLRYQLSDVKVFEIIPPLVDNNMTKGRGKGKITPKQLVDEFLRAYKDNRFEVNIHEVKLLRIVNRMSPAIADRIMKGVTN